MEEPLDDLVEQALRHQAKARKLPTNSSSAFLLSTKAGHCPSSYVSPPTKKGLVKATRDRSSISSKYPAGETEVLKVFDVQMPNRPTTEAFSSIQRSNTDPPPLPGGVPLVDHVAAYVKTSSDWSEISPHVESMRQARLPVLEDTKKWLELTLGQSPASEWIRAKEALQHATTTASLYPYLAADTESTPLANTWTTSTGSSAWEALMTNITMEQALGTSKMEFSIAKSGQSACSFPTRFFFGTVDLQIHIRLPTTQIKTKEGTKMILDLTTSISPEAKELFGALGPMVGVGITSDYVEWAQVMFAVWGTRIFEQVPRPMELVDLARLARINTEHSSIFHLNWWCFGTVLPKCMASLGDSKWGMPMSMLPVALHLYLAGDIIQTAKIASLLTIIIAIHSFPDMTIIKDSSPFSAVTFTQWYAQFFILPHMTGWIVIKTESDGRWRKAVLPKDWEVQHSLQLLIRRLNPPSYADLRLLWDIPDWPSITCGGPRSLHQARAVFLEMLPALRKLDPDKWILHHEDKKLFWRYGQPKDKISLPLTTPVSSPGLLAGPGLENDLPLNPMTWTASLFKSLLVPALRNERPIILEFMRLHPDSALAVHHLSIKHPQMFRSIVPASRVVKVVIDIRNLLGYLNIPFTTPSPDPYHVQEAVKKQVDKAIKHMDAKLSTFMAHQNHYAQKISTVEKAMTLISGGAVPDRIDNMSLLRISTSTSGVAMRGKPTKRPLAIEKLGTAKDELQPARKVIYREDASPPSPEIIPTPALIHPDPVIPVIIPIPALIHPDPVIPVINILHPEIPPASSQHSMDPTFTPEMQSLAQQTLRSNDARVIKRCEGYVLKGVDIKTLAAERLLNDYVIDAYMAMITRRGGQNGLPTVYSFPTYFYPRLAAGGFDIVRNWSRGFDIFAVDIIFFPIHTPGHWSLVAVDFKHSSIHYYDSLHVQSRADRSLRLVQGYLYDEYQDKKQIPLHTAFFASSPVSTPQQNNRFDCGAFLCQFAERISRRAKFNFTQNNMPQFREEMAWEILSNTIIRSPSSTISHQ